MTQACHSHWGSCQLGFQGSNDDLMKNMKSDPSSGKSKIILQMDSMTRAGVGGVKFGHVNSAH
jgi:hypothetical protein